jgi:hypothetical protein
MTGWNRFGLAVPAALLLLLAAVPEPLPPEDPWDACQKLIAAHAEMSCAVGP